jgi:death-on-curing protein
VEYLTAENIIAINMRIQQRAKTSPSIRDAAALDYIVKSASQAVFGQVLYDSIESLATFYLIKVAKKHVFNDANKRTAFQSMIKCLSINGYELIDSTQIDVAKQIVQIAQLDGETDELKAQTLELVTHSIRQRKA